MSGSVYKNIYKNKKQETVSKKNKLKSGNFRKPVKKSTALRRNLWSVGIRTITRFSIH